MSIERMELVNIAGLMKDLDAVLLKCCDSGCFHIESTIRAENIAQGFTTLNEENPYTDDLKLIYRLSRDFGFKPEPLGKSEKNAFVDINEADDYLNGLEDKFRSLSDEKKELSSHISELEQTLVHLKHLKGLDIDFHEIFDCEHIKVRFGKLPVDSAPKLAYYDDKPFYFKTFDNDGDYLWGVYFMPSVHRSVIDDIFDSLHFERIRLPDFVEGTASDAMRHIESELSQKREVFSRNEKELNALLSSEEYRIKSAFTVFKFKHDIFDLRHYASVLDDKFFITGFVPKRDSNRFRKCFDDLTDVSVVINPPEIDERLIPPVKLKNSKFAQPFSMFVEMYGLPSYNGFNPTELVAVTYTLLFGIMFGDLGQGLAIALIGAVMYRLKKNRFGQILTRIGFSSAFFGLVYGSVFGFEEALDPLYKLIGLNEKPLNVMQNTNTVLFGAIGIGIVLILISIIINIFIGFKNKDYERAVFGNNGIAGLVFFGAILAAGVSTLVFGNNLFTPLYIIFLIVLPLAVMFLRVPLGNLLKHKKGEKEGIGNFIASNFFEVFEFLLGYATNTLSFVRIGGFVLSHAGMMAVVMLLSEGVAKGVSPIVIIIGNIFVMGMEGMIVGIQVLRLEFYEIFSRFYEGDGHAFLPVRVDYEKELE